MHKILRSALAPLLIFIWLSITFIPYMGGAFCVKAENTTPQSGSYAYIQSDDAFFFAHPDEKEGLFLLPPTYFVRLLNYTDTLCRVEYQTDGTHTKRLVGYVKTEHLVFVSFTPKHPYPLCVFDIDYKIEDAAQISDGFLTQITMSCTYYGDYKIGSATYCYVLREGEFGYIPKPESLIVPENTEYAEYLSSSKTDSDSAQPTPKNNTPAQIAILVTLCLLVPLLAALILKPKSNHDPD